MRPTGFALLLAACRWSEPTSVPAAEPPETVLAQSRFPGPGLPPDWHVSGPAWRVDDGAYSPAHPASYGAILYYRRGPSGRSTLDRKTIAARVEVLLPQSIFALCTQGTYGTIAEVDGRDRVLRLYQSWKGEDPPHPLGTVALPFSLEAGHSYTVTLTRTLGADHGAVEHETVFTLAGGPSGRAARFAAFFDGKVDHWPGHMWGAPGILFRSGAIRVRDFNYGAPYPRRPLLWVGGDSFVEGDSIYASKDRRFAQLVANALGDRAVVSGGGGDTSGQLLARLDMDFEPFRPKYCLILIGANDRSFEEWRPNVERILARVRGRGAIPLLGTLAPRAGRQEFLDRANAWILQSGETVVDFAAALTLNGDRLTWNPVLARGDGVHPNVAGHAAMFSRLERDAPFLFSASALKPERAHPGARLRRPAQNL